jgi:hypothetical protein
MEVLSIQAKKPVNCEETSITGIQNKKTAPKLESKQ